MVLRCGLRPGPGRYLPCLHVSIHTHTCAIFIPLEEILTLRSSNYECTAPDPLTVSYPGISDLANVGWMDKLNGWYCVYNSDASDAEAAAQDGDEGCCSATIKLPAPTGHAVRPSGLPPLSGE